MTQNIQRQPNVSFQLNRRVVSSDVGFGIAVGRELARQGRTLVYGGGNRGIMGILSAAVLENGGRVHGVLPRSMANKQGESQEGTGSIPKPADTGDRWTEEIVDSMHVRKTKMANMAQGGFIGLPGGFGTFEEVSRIMLLR